MKFSLSFVAAALLALPALSFAGDAHHVPAHRRHHNKVAENAVARRASSDLAERGLPGGNNARATFFAVGLGACGIYNKDSDFIVALNVAQYGDTGVISPYCFKMITITYNGKTTQAQITDACPGCPYGGLDMSPGLFQYFAPSSQGVFYMDWWIDGQGGGQPTTSKWTPTITWSPATTWSPSPTTTWSPSPTSTWHWTPTSTWSSTTSWSSSSKHSSSSWSSKKSSSSSTTTSSSSATPTPTPQNINNLNAALVGLAELVQNAAQ